MTLGLFLSLGESFSDLKSKGQDQLMINQQISTYAKNFKHIYVFTYKKEVVKLPKNCTLITPPYELHRYLYGLILPFIHIETFKKLDALRCYQLFGALPGIVAKLFLKKKLIFNYGYDYSQFAQLESKPFHALFIKIFEPVAIKTADHIIIKNKLLASQVKNHNSKFTHLPNGVDINKFKPYKKNSQRFSLLFVGRLEPQKKILLLLQAITYLKPRPHLTIIGNGSLKSKITSFAKKNNLKVALKSKVPHQQMPKFYSNFDVFILPSITEGSSKVLLEAMASGLACIATNIPENREIIQSGKHGILTKPQTTSLARAIKKLQVSKSLRKKLSQNARQQVLKKFQINKIMNQEISIIKSL